MLAAGLMTSTTSSVTRRSSLLRGVGCGATEGLARPGVDGETAHYVTAVRGEQAFLSELRAALKRGASTRCPYGRR
jgi:hypothetical protein